MNDGRSYVTGYFALDLDGLDRSSASGDSFVSEPQELSEPPGDLPIVIIDDPADDPQRANTDGGASGDRFAFAPQESREPPGELPLVIIDDPADDPQRANTVGPTIVGDSGASSMDAAVICLLGDSSAQPKDGSDFFLI